MIDQIRTEIDPIKEQLISISDYMQANPEISGHEYQAVKLLVKLLREHNFSIEEGIAGLPTAFKAEFDSGSPGPVVAYFCEYDALPEIGHCCGHNLIAAMGAGAGIVLSKLMKNLSGKVVVYGTPAEEAEGAKVTMTEQGLFAGLDAAIILHPDAKSYESGISLAMDAIQYTFFGKASHAAASPSEGINALEAAILFFNGVNSYRMHCKPDIRIHGFISEGGIAANIITERAQARFEPRALKKKDLQAVVQRMEDIARGAALMTGTTVEISRFGAAFDDMLTNQTLSAAFSKNMRLAGVTDVEPPNNKFVSSDMGNVSHVAPSIHPWISIGNPNLILHEKSVAADTITDTAHEQMMKGIAAMVLTGYEVITDTELLKAIKEEFKKDRED